MAWLIARALGRRASAGRGGRLFGSSRAIDGARGQCGRPPAAAICAAPRDSRARARSATATSWWPPAPPSRARSCATTSSRREGDQRRRKIHAAEVDRKDSARCRDREARGPGRHIARPCGVAAVYPGDHHRTCRLRAGDRVSASSTSSSARWPSSRGARSSRAIRPVARRRSRRRARKGRARRRRRRPRPRPSPPAPTSTPRSAPRSVISWPPSRRARRCSSFARRG